MLLGFAFGVAWFVGVFIAWIFIRSLLWLVCGIYHWFIEGFVSNCTHSWNLSDW